MGLLLFAEYNYLELIERWFLLKAKKNIPATSWTNPTYFTKVDYHKWSQILPHSTHLPGCQRFEAKWQKNSFTITSDLRIHKVFYASHPARFFSTAWRAKAKSKQISCQQVHCNKPMSGTRSPSCRPGTVQKYATANWSLRQGDEEINKRVKQKYICYIFNQTAQYFGLKTHLLQFSPWRFVFESKYWAISLNMYYFFVLFFCLLLNRLAVRISLPFHIFLDQNPRNQEWSRAKLFPSPGGRGRGGAGEGVL